MELLLINRLVKAYEGIIFHFRPDLHILMASTSVATILTSNSCLAVAFNGLRWNQWAMMKEEHCSLSSHSNDINDINDQSMTHLNLSGQSTEIIGRGVSSTQSNAILQALRSQGCPLASGTHNYCVTIECA